MARLNERRSRAHESDGEDGSRANTPLSTAPNDRKRARPTPSNEPSSSPLVPSTQLQSRKSIPSAQDDRKFALAPKSIHQPGAIVRVKLTNFVTYTSAEFFPGPNLNMVIGPNGTGKSTLVCAIALGLGFKTDVLGRAKDASEFVKHGTREATIEIELRRATVGENRSANNPIITRKIRKDDNKSTYLLNGQSSTNKAVLGLARDLNIQCDNLCQFLPQDRVVEFAQMNTVEMLSTTLRAAAEPEVLEYYRELKTLREEQVDYMDSTKGSRDHLANLEKRQQAQTADVERLKARMQITKRIDNLEKCKPLPKYLQARRLTSQLRTQKERLSRETAQLRVESEPTLRKTNAKEEYAADAIKYRNSHKREVKRAEEESRRIDQQIIRCGDSVKQCMERISKAKEASKTDKATQSKLQQELRRLLVLKENAPEPFDSRTINEQIHGFTVNIRNLQGQIDDKHNEVRSIKERGKPMLAKKKTLEDKLNNLSTQEGQQDSKLEELSKDTYKAWQWIKNNQQLFKKEVFGPPAVTCSVRNPVMTSAVEALIERSQMRILTVQCQEDFKLLQQELIKKQRLTEISLRECNKTDLSSFKPPMRDEELNTLGLQQWAVDCLEGPPTVLAMLCQESFLHQQAISNNAVTDAQHDAIASSPIKGYVAGRSAVAFKRRAEYDASAVSARTKPLQIATVWTDQPVDSDRRQRISDEIKRVNIDLMPLKNRNEQLKEELAKLMPDIEELRRKEQALRTEKDDKQKAQAAYNGLDTKIEQNETKTQQCKDRLDSSHDRCKEIAKQKDDYMFQKAEAILRYCENAHVLKEAYALLLEAELSAIEAQSDVETLKELTQHIADTLRRKKDELRLAEQEHKAELARAKVFEAQARELQAESERLQQGEPADEDLANLIEELRQDKDLSEASLEARLDVESAKLELTAGGLDAENTLREYQDREQKIEKLREKLEDFNEKNAEYIDRIKMIRDNFEADLDPIIRQIDTAFAESFARIGCAGQVAVHKASSDDPTDCTDELGGKENGLDFANWAIHISVKFRESETLQLLDSHRQSGGERAVSTIFYLMALQSLSKSPFRVVDEINQGMDQRNERMVHGRMVGLATDNEKAIREGRTSGGSQYFLITPKLLSGLRYEPGMTVLCIMSGENMPSATDIKKVDENGASYVEKGRKIDFAALARRARSLGLNQLADGGDSGRMVDSGVGMGVSVGA